MKEMSQRRERQKREGRGREEKEMHTDREIG